jgi:hypothetical protein
MQPRVSADSTAIKRKYGRETQVSQLTGIPVRTLQRWRFFGGGPEWYRVGRMVLYDLDKVEEFIRAGGRNVAA